MITKNYFFDTYKSNILWKLFERQQNGFFLIYINHITLNDALWIIKWYIQYILLKSNSLYSPYFYETRSI